MVSSAYLFLCVGMCLFAQAPASGEWTPAELLKGLTAREASITSLSANINMRFVKSPDAKKELEIRYHITCLDEKYIKHNPTVKPIDYYIKKFDSSDPPPSFAAEFFKDSKHDERIDIHYLHPRTGASLNHSLYIYKDSILYTLTKDTGFIGNPDGMNFPRMGFPLGIDCDWDNRHIANTKYRSFVEVLEEALSDAGRVGSIRKPTTTEEQDLVILNLLLPVTDERFKGKNMYADYAVQFDKRRGLAPAGIICRFVQRTPSGLAEVLPPHWKEYHWSDFEEDAPGIWLPRKFVCKGHSTLYYPKDESEFVKGERMNRSNISKVIVLSYVSLIKDYTLSNVRVNTPLDKGLFEMSFPEGATVRDEIRGKNYHVGRYNKLIEMELKSSWAMAKGGSSFTSRMLILILVNAALLGILLVVLRIRRKRWAR